MGLIKSIELGRRPDVDWRQEQRSLCITAMSPICPFDTEENEIVL